MILHKFLRSESTIDKIYISSNLIDFDDGCGTFITGEWRIWNYLQLEILQEKLRKLGKNSSIFYKRRKRTMTVESSTSRRLRESKRNIFYRKQKYSFCNIRCFKNLLTSVQKIDL